MLQLGDIDTDTLRQQIELRWGSIENHMKLLQDEKQSSRDDQEFDEVTNTQNKNDLHVALLRVYHIYEAIIKGNGWYIPDQNGGIRGPFPTTQVDEWIETGFLHDECLISSRQTEPFVPVGIFNDSSMKIEHSIVRWMNSLRELLILKRRQLKRPRGLTKKERYLMLEKKFDLRHFGQLT
jgi:hypothetical protein